MRTFKFYTLGQVWQYLKTNSLPKIERSTVYKIAEVYGFEETNPPKPHWRKYSNVDFYAFLYCAYEYNKTQIPDDLQKKIKEDIKEYTINLKTGNRLKKYSLSERIEQAQKYYAQHIN